MKKRISSERVRLTKLLLASFLVVAILLGCDFLVTYPSVSQSLITLAEEATAQIAGHLARMVETDVPLSSLVRTPDFLESAKEIKTDFGLWKLKVYSASGRAVYSTEASEIGAEHGAEEFWQTVARGNRFTQLRKKGARSLEGGTIELDVVETYIPVIRDGQFVGAFELYYDVTHFTTSLDRAFLRSHVLLLLLGAFFLVFLIFMARRELRMIAINAGLAEQIVHSEKLSAVGQLAAGVAHEFNNVLNNISMGVQRLLSTQRQKEGPLSQQCVVLLEKIMVQSQRGSRVASDVLAMSKPGDLHTSLCFIEDVIDESIQLQLRLLRFHGFSVVKDYAYTGKVLIDAGQMQQVFLNLVTNAAHAMQSTNDGTITISVRRNDKGMKIRFSDTGTGIAPEDRHKIFTPFYTTKGGFTKEGERVEGTGLGLAVSYRVIENHGGDIRFESEEGKGTTFVITLPVAQVAQPSDRDEPEGPVIEAQPAEVPAAVAQKVRVLVVDDEELVVEELLLLLEDRGYSGATGACSAAEALERFRQEPFELVFIDLVLPDMPGSELLEAIASIERDTRFIITSGQVGADRSKWTDRENVLAYFSNPFDIL